MKNAVRNSFFGVLGQVILIIVGFFSQRTMNLLMGAELVGMNGVISNVIAILSVSELGVSTAVVYNLYGPLARGDQNQIAGLMNLYRKAYHTFSGVILGLGLIMMPWIPALVNAPTFTTGYIRQIFFLWLAKTALSYLLSYKRSVLIADQKEYLISIATLIVNVVNYSTIIAVLYLTRNYVLALTLNILVDFLNNLILAAYVDRKYPYLVTLKKTAVGRDMLSKVIGNIKDIFVQKLFVRLLSSTDNLILSGFLGAVMAGLYSNYCLVVDSIFYIMSALANAIQPTLAHFFLESGEENNYSILRQVTFLFFFVNAAAAGCVFPLISLFVRDFWLSEDYLLGMGFVLLMTVRLVVMSMNLPLRSIVNAAGLFAQEKVTAVAVSVTNLVISLILVVPLGLEGIVLGTIAAYVLQFGCRVFFLFRNFLHMGLKVYLWDLLKYVVLIVLETGASKVATDFLYREGQFYSFLLCGVVCGVAICAVNLLLFSRSDMMKACLALWKDRRKDGSRRDG